MRVGGALEKIPETTVKFKDVRIRPIYITILVIARCNRGKSVIIYLFRLTPHCFKYNNLYFYADFNFYEYFYP